MCIDINDISKRNSPNLNISHLHFFMVIMNTGCFPRNVGKYDLYYQSKNGISHVDNCIVNRNY